MNGPGIKFAGLPLTVGFPYSLVDGYLGSPARRFLNLVNEVVQSYRLVEVGLAAVAFADTASKLIVHLAYVVGRSPGHSLQHVGIFGWNRQVFELVSALYTLDADSIVIGGFVGGCYQGTFAAVDFRTAAVAAAWEAQFSPGIAGDVDRCHSPAGKPAADQDIVR